MKRVLGIGLIISLLIVTCPAQAQDDPSPLTLEKRLGQGVLTTLAWSPDGRTLAVDSLAGIWLVDTADFSAPPRLLEGPVGMSRAIAFSPDSRTIATGSEQWEQEVWLWDVISGERQAVIATPDSAVESLAWSPDGQILATGEGYPGFKIRLWDVTTRTNFETLDRHSGPVTSLAYTPDGTRLVSGSEDSTVQGWDEEVTRALTRAQGRLDRVSSLSLHPTQQILAIGTSDAAVRFWDADQQGALLLEGHTGWINSVAFSPDGQLLASAGANTILLWSVPELVERIAQSATLGLDETWVMDKAALEGHTASVIDVAFSPDSTRLASVSGDGSVRIWDVASRETLVALGGPTGEIGSLAFSPDGTILVAGYYNRQANNGSIQLWNTTTGERHAVFDIGPVALAYRPNTTQLAASTSREIILLDTTTGQPIKTMDAYTGDTYSAAQSLAFSPDGSQLAAGYADGAVRLWDANAATLVREFAGGTSQTDDLVFSPDGRTLAAVSFWDDQLRLWDVETGQLITSLQVEGVRCLAYHPDGTTLATMGYDRQFWNVTNADRVPTIKGLIFSSGSAINAVAYYPDGALMAAAGDQGTLLIVNAANSVAAMLPSGRQSLHSTAFSPDGTRLAAAGTDGVIRLWDVPDDAALALAGTPVLATGPATCTVTRDAGAFRLYGSPDYRSIPLQAGGELALDGRFVDEFESIWYRVSTGHWVSHADIFQDATSLPPECAALSDVAP